MFTKKSQDGYFAPLDKIEQKTLVHGENTLMVEFKMKKGAIVPLHCHPHEQTGYLISGHIKFLMNSKEVDCQPGDSWCLPGNQEHGAEALEDSVIVEVFSPVREDYLPK